MDKSIFIAIAVGALFAIGIHASEKGTRNNFCNGDCNNNICDGVANNTALPNEAGCNLFFICIDGRPMPNTCPQGQWFNYNISQCDNSTSPCEFEFECPPDGIHFFPHDQYCDKFIMCFAGFPIIMSCADGLYFDRELGQCNFPDYVECEYEVCPPKNDPENITFIPSDRFCEKFYICYSGDPIGFWCPEGLHFNPLLNTCDFPESANCTIEDPENPPGPPQPHEIDCDCAESIYFVPHPNSCEHYFICSFGESILLSCAPGFHFDPENNWCDFSDNVQCGANTTTTTTTTTRPPCQNPGFNCSANEVSFELPPVILTPIFEP